MYLLRFGRGINSMFWDSLGFGTPTKIITFYVLTFWDTLTTVIFFDIFFLCFGTPLSAIYLPDKIKKYA